MSSEIILPIITLIIGWMLTEFSYSFRTKREDLKSIALAISCLLEIRHWLKGMNYVFNELKKIIPISPVDELQIRKIVDAFIPKSENIYAKYEESVNLISMFNPILGFQLRSKEQFTPTMQKLRSIVPEEINSTMFMNELEKIISTKYLEIIEETLIELAKMHGFKSRLKIKKMLTRPDIIPDEMNKIFSMISNNAKK